MKVRYKMPVVCNALKYTGDNDIEFEEFIDKHSTENSSIFDVHPGDWIVFDHAGTNDIFTQDEFELNFDLVLEH